MTLTKLTTTRNRTAFVVERDGEPVGYLWRNKNTRTTTTPWQVKVYTGTMPCPATGAVCHTGELVTSVYPNGKGTAASNTAKNVCLTALAAVL